ncbi:hypothetical protein DFP72DRAFT_1162413 [Ephemerocybe angulata]|uniref:Uncharacterized protein n=1 Tax=Ephemerocybe angulata TaxID=980116 RepID=A0A8H6MGD4_9AGAR|nr:hypothetical protein DFP72DRAFT_1162413 [Tulosesus angulatus]
MVRNIKLCPHTCHTKNRGGPVVLTGLYLYKTDGGVLQSHEQHHANKACDCDDTEWEPLPDIGFLRFGYRLYFAYKNSRHYNTFIKKHYKAGWAEFFGPESIPMFYDGNPVDLSNYPALEAAYPVPWQFPSINDLLDPEDPDAPRPTPHRVLARVPVPIAMVDNVRTESESEAVTTPTMGDVELESEDEAVETPPMVDVVLESENEAVSSPLMAEDVEMENENKTAPIPVPTPTPIPGEENHHTTNAPRNGLRLPSSATVPTSTSSFVLDTVVLSPTEDGSLEEFGMLYYEGAFFTIHPDGWITAVHV